MTSRARILCVSLSACFLLVTSSVCRSQSPAATPTNSAAPVANQADVEAAVEVLCKPADISHSKTGSITGCNTCPKGTDFFGQNMGGWYFGASTVGHFTS